jgi:sulfotransferase family protein
LPWIGTRLAEPRTARDEAVWYGSVSTLEDYQALFAGATGERAIGEASPLYLPLGAKAAGRIRHYTPEMKLIAILRDPVHRAYSHFLHNRKHGFEPHASFAEALASESPRGELLYLYRNLGFYYSQLGPFLDRFERDQLLIAFHDDLETDAVALLRSVFRFLGVDDGFTPDVSRREMASVDTYGPADHAAMQEVRARLVKGYSDDILRLQDLVGRDLSAWLRS